MTVKHDTNHMADIFSEHGLPYTKIYENGSCKFM